MTGSSRFLVSCCILPWLGMLLSPRQDDPSKWTAGRWAEWRDGQIDRILTPTFDHNGERLLSRDEVIQRSAEASVFLSPYLADPAFLGDADRASALGNFAKFVFEQRKMALVDSFGASTNGLGMDITDREYWEYVKPEVAFPELLESQEFLKAMSNPATYQRGVTMIIAHNAKLPPAQKWVLFPFRAQFIQSFDHTTYGRLLILIPNVELPDGSVLDRWVAFAIATPDLNPIPEVKSVSVIATMRDPKNPGRNRGFFADFLRQRDPATGEIKINSTFLMNPSPSKNCYDCHKTAVLPIHPKAIYRFDAAGKLIESPVEGSSPADTLNSLILRYGKSDFGHLDPAAFGPSLGQIRLSRSDDFILEATRDQPIERSSFPAIRRNMNCSGCHDQFASLNYVIAVRTSGDVKAFESKLGLVQTYIEKGYMPPNNTLSPAERHALWECVMKEYFDPEAKSGTFVDWLRGAPRRAY